MTTAPETALVTNRTALAAVLAAVMIFGLTLGLTYPLLSLVLEARGHTEFWIGLNGAMTPLGFLLASPLAPGMVRKFGFWPTMATSLLAVALCLAALGLTESLAAWFVLRLILGVAINNLYLLSETWINVLANAAARGRLLALYSTLMAIGFGSGPAILAVTGPSGFLPFGIGIAAAIVSFAPLLMARRHAPTLEPGDYGSLLAVFPLILVMVGGVVALAFYDTVTLSLLPVYALRSGMSEAGAALAVTALVFGNIALQIPLGWVSDRFGRKRAFALCASAGVIGALVLPFVTDTILFWPTIFLWGGITFAVYPITLAMLGDRLSGSGLLAGNAVFAMAWGVGGLLGPAATGAAMTAVGPQGLPLTLGLLWAGVLLSLLRRPTIRG